MDGLNYLWFDHTLLKFFFLESLFMDGVYSQGKLPLVNQTLDLGLSLCPRSREPTAYLALVRLESNLGCAFSRVCFFKGYVYYLGDCYQYIETKLCSNKNRIARVYLILLINIFIKAQPKLQLQLDLSDMISRDLSIITCKQIYRAQRMHTTQ